MNSLCLGLHGIWIYYLGWNGYIEEGGNSFILFYCGLKELVNGLNRISTSSQKAFNVIYDIY